MAWEQLSINKPHLAYLILGGFTSLFMLCSLFVKEKMYIGEATVATICGVIFGPHAANLFNPLTWGNTDQITLECSRVVLVVQCFAVGVELPKAYMERHWRSVVFLLVPVMTFGWLITSLFIWWMIVPLTWLESLACAACVTATDPVLASSVVGKGKFAKRVPKHLRDILSAESGCNDGMAFPFIYLSFYLIQYRPDTSKVSMHWFCYTILYECIFGAIYGVLIGYLARHAIKWADRKDLVDRESFLVFYFVLALFCAGTGATLGTDDLLVGFAAGVGFSNDGWFTEKTEESHVSNVIDLLLNLAYFVYLGSIIPWEQYNNPAIGLTPWRLVVIAIFVVLFRRIPIMMALKPLIPDIKTWREALFAGHFGPIGVGAIFAAILARAELETDTTEPLAVVPTDPESEHYTIVQVIWPLTTFLVITSILVHGSSIAVFTLGKRINSFTLTMSYTQVNEEGPSWMNRLPRIASTMSKSSMSKGRDDFSATSSMEKPSGEYPPGMLPPVGMTGNFLRRQKEEDTPIEKPRPTRRKSRWESGMGPGGVIEQSAIAPQRRSPPDDSVSDTLNEKSGSPTSSDDIEEDVGPRGEIEPVGDEEKANIKPGKESRQRGEPELEVFEEGHEMIIEDEEGETLAVYDTKGETDAQKRQHVLDTEEKLRKETTGEHAKGKFHPHQKNEGEELEKAVEEGIEHPEQTSKRLFKRLGAWDGFRRKEKEPAEPKRDQPLPSGSVPARAYQFGHTLIVEDEDGEVLKKIDLTKPAPARTGRGGMQNTPTAFDSGQMRQGLKRMGTWAGLGGKEEEAADQEAASAQPGPISEASADPSSEPRKKSVVAHQGGDGDDDGLRFTVAGVGGRRMSKQEFITQLSQMDPKQRRETLNDAVNLPDRLKTEMQSEAGARRPSLRGSVPSSSYTGNRPRAETKPSTRGGNRPGLEPLDEHVADPGPPIPSDDDHLKIVRRNSTQSDHSKASGNDLKPIDTAASGVVPAPRIADAIRKAAHKRQVGDPGTETAAERRRRLALTRQDSEDDGTMRVPPSIASATASGRNRGDSEASGEDRSAVGGETMAERRRRLAALGEDSGSAESDSDDDGQERQITTTTSRGAERVPEAEASGRQQGGSGSAIGKAPDRSDTAKSTTSGIRFADAPASSQGRIQWGEGVGDGVKGKGNESSRSESAKERRAGILSRFRGS